MRDTEPIIHESVFVAPGAVVVGDVELEEDSSVWYHVTIRGDRAPIHVGRGSNIQDNCVVHVGDGFPVRIGENVTVGHSAVVHGTTIGNNCLIGMGAILMNGSRIGDNCIIGAGSLVPQGREIPAGSLVMGSPARVIRPATDEELERAWANTRLYVEEAARYRDKGR